MQKLRSTSIQGLSVITVYFDGSSDIYRDRQVVAEQLAVAAQQLPQGVKAPTMTPLTSSARTVLVGGFTSKTRSLMQLRTIADWTLRPALLAVPGVADVVIYGGDTRSIQIKIHPYQLIRYNLSIDDVLTAARRATGIRGAGFVDTANQHSRRRLRRHRQPAHRLPDRRTIVGGRRHRAHGAGERGRLQRDAR